MSLVGCSSLDPRAEVLTTKRQHHALFHGDLKLDIRVLRPHYDTNTEMEVEMVAKFLKEGDLKDE